jgi:HEAT repeat protein
MILVAGMQVLQDNVCRAGSLKKEALAMKWPPTVLLLALAALAALVTAAGCATQSGRVPKSWPPGPGGTALHPLLEALRSDSWITRYEAAMAVSQIPEPGLVNPLIAALGDPDRNYRLGAAEALQYYLMAPERLQERLFAVTPKPPPGYDRKRYEAEMSAQATAVRQALTAAFRRSLAPSADPASAALLFGANDYWIDYDWRDVEADKVGRDAAGPLSGLLKHENPDVRGGAAIALGKIGRSDTVEPVIALLNDGDPDVRMKAARALADFGDSRAVRPLIAALKRMEIPDAMRICGNEPEPEWEPAARAAWALGKLKATEAVDPLIASLKEGDCHFEMCVAEALGRIGDPKAIAPLIALWREDGPDLGLHMFISQALAGFGRPAVGPLVAAIKEDGDRSDFFFCLQEIGEPAIEPLIALLSDDNEKMRWQAAFALGEIKSPTVLARLSEIMSGGNLRTRLAAVQALGWVKDQQAVVLLVAAIKDPVVEVRVDAIEALIMLRSMADDENCRRAIDAKSQGPLVTLAETDPDERVRNAAAVAVENIKADRN